MIHLIKDAAPKEMNHLSTWPNTAIPSYTAWIGSWIPFRPFYWPWNLGSSESSFSYHNLTTCSSFFLSKVYDWYFCHVLKYFFNFFSIFPFVQKFSLCCNSFSENYRGPLEQQRFNYLYKGWFWWFHVIFKVNTSSSSQTMYYKIA